MFHLNILFIIILCTAFSYLSPPPFTLNALATHIPLPTSPPHPLSPTSLRNENFAWSTHAVCAVLFVLDILLNYKIEYIQSIRPELSLTNQIWQKKNENVAGCWAPSVHNQGLWDKWAENQTRHRHLSGTSRLSQYHISKKTKRKKI